MSGIKADGLPKVRAVDDMTASMINESTQQGEKLKCETLDLLFEVSKRLAGKVKVRELFFLAVIFPISCIFNCRSRFLYTKLTLIVPFGGYR